MCAFAYAVSLVVYQLGSLFSGGGFGIGTVAGLLVLAGLLYLVFRPAPDLEHLAAKGQRSVSVGA